MRGIRFNPEGNSPPKKDCNLDDDIKAASQLKTHPYPCVAKTQAQSGI